MILCEDIIPLDAVVAMYMPWLTAGSRICCSDVICQFPIQIPVEVIILTSIV